MKYRSELHRTYNIQAIEISTECVIFELNLAFESFLMDNNRLNEKPKKKNSFKM